MVQVFPTTIRLPPARCARPIVVDAFCRKDLNYPHTAVWGIFTFDTVSAAGGWLMSKLFIAL